MSPQEIQDAYEIVVKDIQNQTANQAAAIGNSQRSLGTLAERVASPSGQTSGLANYTYDRVMRPTVDTLSANLTTNGKAAALENILKTRLREAKNRYEDAKNNYTVASTAPKNNGGNGNNLYSESDDDALTDGKRKDESTGDPNGPVSTATEDDKKTEALADTVNAYAAVTGGGQVKAPSTGAKFSYTLNGSKHVGYVFPEEGGEIDGYSFTREGLKNYLDSKMKAGATFQNYLGNDTNYSIWKLAFKIY